MIHLIAVISFVGFFSYVGINYITQRHNQMLYQTIEVAESLLISEVDDQMDDIVAMANMVRSDTQIQNALDIIRDENRVGPFSSTIYSVLERSIQSHRHRYINYTLLSNPKFMNSTYGFVRDSLTDGELQTLKAKAKQANGAGLWVPKDNDTYYYIQEVKKIRELDLSDLGTYIVSMNPEKFFAEIAKKAGVVFEKSKWIIRQNDSLVYISEGLEEIEGELNNSNDSYEIVSINGERVFVTRGNSKYFSYVHLVPYEELAASVERVRLNTIYGLAAAMALMLIFVHLLIGRMTAHFDYLIKDMDRFEGDYTALKPLNGLLKERKDEVGILHQQFHEMAKKVSALIEQNYKKELLIKDAQLGNLESQMNPHFLYNTLESINWRAKMKGEKEISSIVESLGQFLRISLREKEDSYSLGKEVEVINCYMTIQKLRFEDRLDFDIDIPEELLKNKVPKLSVQPLVENAIQYALEEMVDICEIRVSAKKVEASEAEKGNDEESNKSGIKDSNRKYSKDTMEIRVSNTGSEFDDNMIEVLKARRGNKKGLGIALLNIEDRIHLMFGEEYGLRFSNEDDQAVVTMVLPIECCE